MASPRAYGYPRRSRSVISGASFEHTLKLACSGATESVVRCEPGEDATNGFFVACFERASSRKRKAGDDEDDHDHDRNADLDADNTVEPSQSPAKKKRKKKKKKSKPMVSKSEIVGSTSP